MAAKKAKPRKLIVATASELRSQLRWAASRVRNLERLLAVFERDERRLLDYVTTFVGTVGDRHYNEGRMAESRFYAHLVTLLSNVSRKYDPTVSTVPKLLAEAIGLLKAVDDHPLAQKLCTCNDGHAETCLGGRISGFVADYEGFSK